MIRIIIETHYSPDENGYWSECYDPSTGKDQYIDSELFEEPDDAFADVQKRVFEKFGKIEIEHVRSY